MTANYHTHTKRCHHAVGTDERYVKAAINAGFEVLGFSDHGPWPYENGYSSPIRMTADEAVGYIKSIKKLKEKYRDKIEIKLGFEWEYFPAHLEWMQKFKEENQLDYIILGHHFVPYEIGGEYTGQITTPDGLYKYCENIVDAIKSGAYAYIAHPDLFMSGYAFFDSVAGEVSETICRTAKEYNLPIEYNVLGLRKCFDAGKELYPYSDFWSIARETGNRVIIGVDAHDPKHFSDKRFILKAEDYLNKNGFDIVERL